MRTRFRSALLAATALAAALPALAQTAAPPPPAGANQSARGPGPRGPGALFDEMDKNKDNRVTWDEAWTYVQGRFSAADADRDGGLTRQEADALRPTGGRRREGAAQPSADQAARRARFGDVLFRGMDANRDGRVTLDELRPVVEARFRGFDANGDNAVERAELPQRREGPRQRGDGGQKGQGQREGAPASPR